MRLPLSRAALGAWLVLAACGEDPRVAQQEKARRDVAAVQEQVRAAPRVPSTGRWSTAQLTQRLVNAGLAPYPDDSMPSHPRFPVAPVGYRVGKARYDYLPADVEVLAQCEPVYAEFDGWREPTHGAKSWKQLPVKARDYLKAIAELSGAKLAIVSVGPGREQTIFV